jgi:hypothetical protein
MLSASSDSRNRQMRLLPAPIECPGIISARASSKSCLGRIDRNSAARVASTNGSGWMNASDMVSLNYDVNLSTPSRWLRYAMVHSLSFSPSLSVSVISFSSFLRCKIKKAVAKWQGFVLPVSFATASAVSPLVYDAFAPGFF